MKEFEFKSADGRYTYYLIFSQPGWIDIQTKETGYAGRSAWIHKIVDDKIIWRQDDFLKLTQEAKDYIATIVRREGF